MQGTNCWNGLDVLAMRPARSAETHQPSSVATKMRMDDMDGHRSHCFMILQWRGALHEARRGTLLVVGLAVRDQRRESIVYPSYALDVSMIIHATRKNSVVCIEGQTGELNKPRVVLHCNAAGHGK